MRKSLISTFVFAAASALSSCRMPAPEQSPQYKTDTPAGQNPDQITIDFEGETITIFADQKEVFAYMEDMRAKRDSLPHVDTAPDRGIPVSYPSLCEAVFSRYDVLFVGEDHQCSTEIKSMMYGPEAFSAYFSLGVNGMLVEDNVQSPADTVRLEYQTESFLTGRGKTTEKEFIFKGVDPQKMEERPAVLCQQSSCDWRERARAHAKRMALDTVLFDNIKDAVSKTGKCVMRYGVAHGSYLDGGLLEDESLSLFKVDVFKSAGGYQAYLDKCIENRAVDKAVFGEESSYGLDLPHAVYLLDEGKIYLSDKVDKDLEMILRQGGGIKNTLSIQSVELVNVM